MARLPRIDLPGIPQHIVQRGNNRLPCFLDDGDRLRYLHLMHEALHATGCQLHAYVLMDNHVHLLVTPPAAGRIGQLIQRLGRNYVAAFAFTYSSSEPWATTPSAQWSKPRPTALRASGPLIAHADRTPPTDKLT
ncbi:REP element-mobilizing transposase RayT [Xanthomonas arboricola]|uniref:transposase n=1 Tax=Xanthomonas arboricola TaxID=56448 RepID=UPI0017D18CC7|nr:transposase [Xanthomonas arboricola]MBB4605695.1 REP element-mobilizing transposase RayT [Xanthomonas arboricola]